MCLGFKSETHRNSTKTIISISSCVFLLTGFLLPTVSADDRDDRSQSLEKRVEQLEQLLKAQDGQANFSSTCLDSKTGGSTQTRPRSIRRRLQFYDALGGHQLRS
jgi:hypothetical protein